MERKSLITLLCAAGAMIVAGPAVAGADGAQHDRTCQEFSELRMILEQNATDEDTEVVLFAKGQDDGLRRLRVVAPNGRKVVTFKNDGRGIGIREFALESAEPPELDLVLGSFPEGTYTFRGTSVEKDCLRGEAFLSHEIAPEAEIISPLEDEVVPVDSVVVTWAPVVEAVTFIVEVQNEENDDSLTVDVPGTETSFAVPSFWLQPDTEYQIGIGVITDTGNVTFVESAFFTAPE